MILTALDYLSLMKFTISYTGLTLTLMRMNTKNMLKSILLAVTALTTKDLRI